MAETTESIEGSSIQTEPPDPKAVREALLRLRQLAASLPPVDAAAVIRNIREAGTRTICIMSPEPKSNFLSLRRLKWPRSVLLVIAVLTACVMQPAVNGKLPAPEQTAMVQGMSSTPVQIHVEVQESHVRREGVGSETPYFELNTAYHQATLYSLPVHQAEVQLFRGGDFVREMIAASKNPDRAAVEAAQQQPAAKSTSDRFLQVKGWTGTFTMRTPRQQGTGQDANGNQNTWELESSSLGAVLIDKLVYADDRSRTWEGSGKGILVVNHRNRWVDKYRPFIPPALIRGLPRAPTPSRWTRAVVHYVLDSTCVSPRIPTPSISCILA